MNRINKKAALRQQDGELQKQQSIVTNSINHKRGVVKYG